MQSVYSNPPMPRGREFDALPRQFLVQDPTWQHLRPWQPIFLREIRGCGYWLEKG